MTEKSVDQGPPSELRMRITHVVKALLGKDVPDSAVVQLTSPRGKAEGTVQVVIPRMARTSIFGSRDARVVVRDQNGVVIRRDSLRTADVSSAANRIKANVGVIRKA